MTCPTVYLPPTVLFFRMRCVYVCASVFCSQDIKLLSYANQRLFCGLFSVPLCHTAADRRRSREREERWAGKGAEKGRRQTVDRHQIYLNDMQIKLTSTNASFSFRLA